MEAATLEVSQLEAIEALRLYKLDGMPGEADIADMTSKLLGHPNDKVPDCVLR